MPLVINTNIAALNSSRLLSTSSSELAKSLARLSSGSRIISPEDDAAGLAQDTTKTVADLSNYTAEFSQLQNYISDISNKTFNSVSLFGGTGLSITIDSCAATFGMNSANLAGATSTGVLHAYSGVSVSITTGPAAASALNNIKTAIQALANMRAQVGANIQRLNLTSEQLTVLNENLTAANSRLKDVDVATESTKFAKLNILVQSGTAMLAQANVLPQSALRLLG